MKTFDDKRGGVEPGYKSSIDTIQGKVLWKTKTHWLIYVSKDDYYNAFISNIEQKDRYHTTFIGYIVIPKGVVVHTCYLATGFWDGLKALLRSGKTPAVTKTKNEFPEELL